MKSKRPRAKFVMPDQRMKLRMLAPIFNECLPLVKEKLSTNWRISCLRGSGAKFTCFW